MGVFRAPLYKLSWWLLLFLLVSFGFFVGYTFASPISDTPMWPLWLVLCATVAAVVALVSAIMYYATPRLYEGKVKAIRECKQGLSPAHAKTFKELRERTGIYDIMLDDGIWYALRSSDDLLSDVGFGSIVIVRRKQASVLSSAWSAELIRVTEGKTDVPTD